MPDSGTVTVLFTDLVGSTEMLERLGDDTAEEVRRVHFGLLREAAVVHGGREVKTLGDGLMVAFPSALRAVDCAIGMQQRIRRHNEELPDRHLGLRVGLNVGEAITEEEDYFGTPVVVAKRLCDRAGPSEVLLSGLVRGLVGTRGDYAYQDVGALTLKGLHEPVQAWQLDWAGAPDHSVAEQAESTDRASGPVDPGTAPPFPPLLGAAARGGFVGRHRDLDRLRETFARVTGERALQLAVLAGEPGIGKTRLAAEFAREAHAGGAVVLYGRSDEEALVPYQPFVEALGRWVAHADEHRLRGQVEARTELLRLLPELAHRLGGLQTPTEGDPETERYRLFEAVAGLLRDIAATAPIVLVLDDLHWVDKPTALLLRHAARSCADVPLLALCTYRAAEVGRGHPLSETMADVRRHTAFERLPLRGLGAEEVTSLIAARAGAEPDPELARTILQETEGNPFFVSEVVDHLVRSDALVERDGVVTLGESAAEIGIPESIKDIIGRRLDRLPERTRQLLVIASVMGKEFEVGVLEHLGGEPGVAVGDALEVALADGIVEESDRSGDRYRFAHALIRDTLYQELSRSGRLRLHRQVADALEATYSEQPEYFAELAFHYAQAAPSGDTDKAVDYAIMAGRQASEQLAYEEAAAHYGRALQVLDLSRSDALRRCELLLASGEAEWNAGDFDRGREAFKHAAEMADRLGAAEQLARAALGYRGPVGYQTVMIDHTAIDLLSRALAAVDDEDAALRARVMGALAESTIFTSPLARREALGREAIALARTSGDTPALVDALLAAHWTVWIPGNPEDRIAWAREAALSGQATGDPGRCAFARYLEYVDTVEMADAQATAAARSTAVESLRHTGQRYLVWLATAIEAGQALFVGDFEVAERLAIEAQAIGQQGQNQNALHSYGAQMLLIRKEQGRIGEVEPGARAFAAQFPEMPAWRCAHAVTLAHSGRHDEARREVERLVEDDLAALPPNVFWLTGVTFLAMANSEIRDRDVARIIYAQLEPFAGLRGTVCGLLHVGCGELHLGRMASVMGRWEEAVDHLERALAIEREAGTYWVAHAQHDCAEGLLGRDRPGDRERALDLLDEAEAAAGARGMIALADRIKVTRRLALGQSHDLDVRVSLTLGERASQAREDASGLLAKGGQAAVGRFLRGASDARLERRFGTPVAQRVLFTAMTQSFQSRLAFGFEGDILYELTRPAHGAPPDHWTVSISGRKATARPERVEGPALMLRIGLADFVRIVTGELNPIGAMLDGRTEIEGDLTLAARLVEMFGGAAAAGAGVRAG